MYVVYLCVNTLSAPVLRSSRLIMAAVESLEDGSLRTERRVSALLGFKSAPTTISYCISLTVKAKIVSQTGKRSGSTENKMILDNACGTVRPGQVPEQSTVV